jgi:hypothetical protein
MGKCSPLLETDTELVLNLIQADQVSLGDVPRAFRRFPYCNDVWRTGEGFEPPMRLASHSNLCELLP